MECGVNNFIFSEYLNDISICDKLINYYNNSEKFIGKIGNGHTVDVSIKDSTDCHLDPNNQLFKNYIDQLIFVVNLYKEKFAFCDRYSPWGITEHINIQHYAPTQGFKSWHTERVGATFPNCFRHLVFMTYLNDVTDEGETEFFYQNIKFKPRKGLTLIWPADWTYTHRGVPSQTQEKYIITGWFSFFNPIEGDTCHE